MGTWKRNLAAIWVGELVAIAGFSFVFPFLPYYVQELGVTDLKQVEFLSGLLLMAQAIPMAIFSPIWGALADRYGRKLMVERAMFGGAFVLAAMGLVQNVQQLLVLRAIQGALTGTVAAATTLVASSTPKERTGYALGLLQMAVWAGASLGPLVGGLVSDTWGYRAAFYVTGALLFIAGLTVWRFVHEEFTPATRDKTKPSGGFWYGLKLVLRDRSLVSLFSIRTLLQLAVMTLSPILALFVQSLVPPGTRIASLTGLISGVQAATSAGGAVTLGRAGDRLGYRRVLLTCAVAGSLLYLPQFFVVSPWQLLVLQGAVGLVMSGVLASISALQAHLSPEGHQGAVYGVDASATSVANAIGPMLGATVAATFGLRAPFLLAAGGIGLAAMLAWLLLPKPQQTKSPTGWTEAVEPQEADR